MQEATIKDADGVTRNYGFDDFNGMLYVRDPGMGIGREYRPAYKCKDPSQRGLQGAHAEMWASGETAAAKQISP